MEKKIFNEILLERIVSNKASLEEWEVFDAQLRRGQLDQPISAHMETSWRLLNRQSTFIPLQLPKILWVLLGFLALGIFIQIACFFRFRKIDNQNKLGVERIVPASNVAYLRESTNAAIKLETNFGSIHAAPIGYIYPNGEVIQETEGRSAHMPLQLITPPGGIYQLMLSDGTRVWLNAGSSIQFPNRFTPDAVRRVYVSGEAYFEIAAQPRSPFQLHFDQRQLQLNAGKINLNSYPGSTSRIAVVEGEALLFKDTSGQAKLLDTIPMGNLLILDGELSTLTLIENLETAVWKNGYFKFKKERLEDIMEQLGNWYNIQINFEEGSLKDLRCSGTFNRFGSIYEILRTLRQSQEFGYRLEARKLVITK